MLWEIGYYVAINYIRACGNADLEDLYRDLALLAQRLVLLFLQPYVPLLRRFCRARVKPLIGLDHQDEQPPSTVAWCF